MDRVHDRPASAPTRPARRHLRPAAAVRRAGMVLICLLVLAGVPLRGAAIPLGRSDPGAPPLPGRTGSGAAAPVAGPGAGTGATAPVPAGAQWRWPLDPAPAVVRRFLPAPTPWGAGHRGVDLAARVGQPVLAAGAGVVSFSGQIAGEGILAVTHPGGLRTTYQPVGAGLPSGTVVASGQQIGVVAAEPGHCAPATCLHWGLLRGVGPASTYLDALQLLGAGGAPPVLLPLGYRPAPVSALRVPAPVVSAAYPCHLEDRCARPRTHWRSTSAPTKAG
jgi:murein DD-endopeptidase MepM/ murein hydrolase activator NlpD